MKKFARGLASVLLKLSLFNLAFTGALLLVFGTPDLLKKSLEESTFYDTIVSNVIKSSEEAARQQGFPIDDPEVRDAIEDSFPPKTFKKYSDNVIDSIYAWLNGDVAKPNYRIDLSPAKQKLAEELGDYAFRRYANLPPCSLTQLRSLSPSVDPFKVTCKVPGIEPNQVRSDVINRINGSSEFLSDPVITANDLPKDANGNTIFDNLSYLPTLAKFVRISPWVFGFLSILMAAALLVLDGRHSGMHAIGVILAGTGALLLVGTVILAFVFAQVNKPGGALNKVAAGSFQSSILSVTQNLYTEINKNLIIFSVAYIVLGLLILLILRLTLRKISSAKVEGNVVKPVTTETVESTPEKPNDQSPNPATIESTKK